MSRTLVANLVDGVTKGFERKLEINGVGYRAAVQGKDLQLAARLQPRRRLSDPGRASRSRRRSRPRSSITGIDKQRGRPGRRRDPRVPHAGALQGQGRAVRGRKDPPQGRQEEVRPWPCQTITRPIAARQRVRTASASAAERPAAPAACSARRSTSTPRSSTTPQGVTLAAASSLEKDLRRSCKTGADKDAAAEVGKLVAERAIEAGRQGRRLRPRRLPLSRPGQGPGRRRPRRRPEFLRTA